jgi:hypothetical protein
MRFLAKFHASQAALFAAMLALSLDARHAFAQAAGGAPQPSGPPPAAPGPSPAEVSVGTNTVSPAPEPGAPPPGATSPVVSLGAAPAGPSTGDSLNPSAGAPSTGVVGQALRVIEEMPFTAYPAPKRLPRGIFGGSLWFVPDLHGGQWPYYPKTGIGIAGYGWVDTGLREYNAGEATSTSAGLGSMAAKGKQFVQQSRFVLRMTPTWTDPKSQFFVQVQTEFVGAQETPQASPTSLWSVDDAWIRFGKWKLFDVLLGRFQAWEVYHYGMGLDLFTLERSGANDASQGSAAAPQIYGLTYMYLRQDAVGQGAIHLYPTDWLRFEVGFQYGFATSGANTYGVRPVGIAELGPFRIKAGAEFLESRPQGVGALGPATQSQGFGGSIQLVVDPYFECGINGAYALNDLRNAQGLIDANGTNQTYSVGGFANVRLYDNLLFGAGLNYTNLVDHNFDPAVNRDDNYNQWQPFVALQYLLFRQYNSPSPGLFIKFVGAYARADLNPTPMTAPEFRNEMYSGRLRLEYLF